MKYIQILQTRILAASRTQGWNYFERAWLKETGNFRLERDHHPLAIGIV